MKKPGFLILSFLLMLAVKAQEITDTAYLRSQINTYINTNNNRQITGQQLNRVFNGTLNVIGSLLKGKAGIDTILFSGDTLYFTKAGQTGAIAIQSGNFATKDLEFTSDRYHNAKSNALIIDSIGYLLLKTLSGSIEENGGQFTINANGAIVIGTRSMDASTDVALILYPGGGLHLNAGPGQAQLLGEAGVQLGSGSGDVNIGADGSIIMNVNGGAIQLNGSTVLSSPGGGITDNDSLVTRDPITGELRTASPSRFFIGSSSSTTTPALADVTAIGDSTGTRLAANYISFPSLKFGATASIPQLQTQGGLPLVTIREDKTFEATNGQSLLNFYLGRYTGKLTSTGGGGNFFAGDSIGTNMGASYHNIAIGYNSHRALTTGTYNIGLGRATNYSTTSGIGNIALGDNANKFSTTSSYNIVLGYGAAGSSNLIGNYNIAMGLNAMQNARGSANVTQAHIAIGRDVLKNIKGGLYSIGIGYQTLMNDTISSNQIAIGARAMQNHKYSEGGQTVGNTVVGYNAMLQDTTGHSNTVVGAMAGYQTFKNLYGTYVGVNAAYSNTTLQDRVTAIGYNTQTISPVGRTSFANVTAIGAFANSQYDSTVIIGNAIKGVGWGGNLGNGSPFKAMAHFKGNSNNRSIASSYGRTFFLETSTGDSSVVVYNDKTILLNSPVIVSETGLPATEQASAIVDITSTNKGILFPRLTSAQRDAIPSPAIGLLIFNTSTNRLNIYLGTWQGVATETL